LAADENYDYVICGHIHRPQMRTVDVKGKKVTYLNSGDWVENLTALEYKWGRWSIYEYDETDYNYVSPMLKMKNWVEVDDEDDDELGFSEHGPEAIFRHIVSHEAGKEELSA
jgi:hypothetical protein